MNEYFINEKKSIISDDKIDINKITGKLEENRKDAFNLELNKLKELFKESN